MIRKKLRDARIAKRWTQKQLARKLKVSRVTINYWERGVMTPSLYNQDAIKSAFGITDDKQLEDLLSLEEEETHRDSGQTRTGASPVPTAPILPLSEEETKASAPRIEGQNLVPTSLEEELHESVVADSEAAAEDATSTDQSLFTLVTPAYTFPSSSLARSSAPTLRHVIADNDQLDYAESIVNLAWDAWFASRPKQARHEVTKLLPNLERFIFTPVATIHRLRAKELIIRGHGLLGTVYLDARQNDAALYHYMQAHISAQEIHDRDFTTTYLCLIGEVLRQQKDLTGSLLHMESARDKAVHASKATRGHILQLLAYTYGDSEQEAAFERTIAETTDLLAFSGEGRDIVQKEFIPFEVYEIRGKINRELHKPSEAFLYLGLAEQSLAQTNSLTPRWSALLDISRAQVCCDTGDIATGIELACKGFIKAYQCHSQLQMNRVRKLFSKLKKSSPRNHPGMSDLEDLLTDETYMSIYNG